MNIDFRELIPNFQPLLSLCTTQDDAGLNAAAGGVASVLATLRKLSSNSSILNQATIDYLAVIRDVEVVNNRKRLEEECALLAAKYSDIIAALQAVNNPHRAVQAPHGSRRRIIQSLPVELLTLIFTTPTTPADPEHPEQIYEPFDMDMRLVCRRWREVIDNTPVLWARLDLDCSSIDTDQLRVVLARSKQVPLEIIIHVSALDKPLFSVLQPHIARAESLTFYPYTTVPGMDYEDEELDSITEDLREVFLRRGIYYLEQLMEGDFSTLEAIRVEDLRARTSMYWDIQVLSLRYVRIRGSQLSMHLYECHDMTTIILDQSSQFDSLDQCLLVLNDTPRLRHFKWTTGVYTEDRISPGGDVDYFEQGSIRLRRLKHLELCLAPEIIARLIPLLDIPASTRLIIKVVSETEPIAPSPAFTTLLNSLRAALWPHLQKVFANIAPGYHRLHIRPFMKDVDDGFSIMSSHSDTPSASRAPAFTFGMRWSRGSSEACIVAILEVLSWPGMARNVIQFDVSHDEFMQQGPHWQRLLFELPALTSVSVSEQEGILACLEALCVVVPSGFPPALDTVSFLDPPVEAMSLLVKLLDERVEAGRPELSLEFKGFLSEWPEEYLLEYL